MTDLVLYQFPGAYGMVSLSPFCTKLDAYLRLAGLSFESKLGDPRRAPKGKLPYVRLDGQLVGDSGIIIDRLKERFGDALDARLTERQHALGHLARRTAEDHLSWGLLAVRWGDDAIWKSSYRDAIAAMLPPLVRVFAPGLLRRRVQSTMRAHGVGRHSRAEITRACETDLASLEELLGDRPFLLGEAPTSYDCSVYAMLEHLRRTEGEHPLIAAMRSRDALIAYCERMNARIGWTQRALPASG